MRLIALALMLACASASPLYAQTASDFMGTYDLVRFESPNDSGEWVTSTNLFGPDPLGIIMYDGVGSMSVHLVRQDRGAEDATPGIVNGYMAYYGRYEVDAARRVVTHRRRGPHRPEPSRSGGGAWLRVQWRPADPHRRTCAAVAGHLAEAPLGHVRSRRPPQRSPRRPLRHRA